MRLIDADYFKTRITAAAAEINMASEGMAFCKIIDAQQTAYDVDKVVEQIGNISELARPVGWTTKAEIVRTKDVIEIIKAGGEDE